MLYYILILFLVPLNAYAIKIEHCKMLPGSEAFHYTLVDLGETDVSREQLADDASTNSYSPRINDSGVVIYNLMHQGYVRDRFGKIDVKIGGNVGYGHGINRHGDLLVSYGASANDVRWAVCSEKPLCTQKVISIDLRDLLGRNVYLRDLNENGMAVGCFKPAGRLRPLVWTKADGLHHLGYYLGWDIVGSLYGVNALGTAIGTLDDGENAVPYVWNHQWGMKRLQSFGWNWKVATGRTLLRAIQFKDLVIANDDRVFGTFQSTDVWGDVMGAFWWDPHTHQVRSLDWQGMRLNAINAKNTLVGSWKGEAALVDLGGSPILLRELIADEKGGWELLEATDINARGDIVGYGLREGKLHYFLLERGNKIKTEN
ncbi:MAG: hypothetical protein ACXWM7_05590 [Parachlamydiaceae bacterium]